MKRFFFFASAVFLSGIIACKKDDSVQLVQINAATEISRLQNENESLIRENENLKATAINEDKLRGKIEYNYAVKDYTLAKSYINVFMDLFPTSNRALQYRTYYETIEAEENAKKEAELEEYQKSLTDFTGIWTIANFVDEDGNTTNKKYITTTEPFTGTYSDISYDSASFEATLIIAAKNNISLSLYEVEKNQEITANPKSPIRYNIKVTDSSGSSFSFVARNTNDRISFGTNFSSKVHNALLSGGNLKFELSTTRDSYPVKYEFEITSSQFYNTACRLMGIL